MTTTSNPLIIPPGIYLLRVLISAAANPPLLSVVSHIKTRPEEIHEADLIRYGISSEGDAVSGAGTNALFFGLEPDSCLRSVGTHGPHVTLLT